MLTEMPMIWTFVYRSMADQDSDRWIFEVLAPDLRRKIENLEDEVQWTDLMSVKRYLQFTCELIRI